MVFRLLRVSDYSFGHVQSLRPRHTKLLHGGISWSNGPKMLACIIEFVTLLFLFFFQGKFKQINESLVIFIALLCIAVTKNHTPK